MLQASQRKGKTTGKEDKKNIKSSPLKPPLGAPGATKNQMVFTRRGNRTWVGEGGRLAFNPAPGQLGYRCRMGAGSLLGGAVTLLIYLPHPANLLALPAPNCDPVRRRGRRHCKDLQLALRRYDTYLYY